MQDFFNNWQTVILLVWSLGWKGWALWRSGKNDQRYWFVVLLVVNTLGVLELVYLLFFQKQGRLWDKIAKKLNLKTSKRKV